MTVLDDFEDGDVTGWSATNAGGSFSASTAVVESGSYAAELELDGSTSGGDNAVYQRTFSVGQPEIVRGFVNVTTRANSNGSDGTIYTVKFYDQSDFYGTLCEVQFDNDGTLRTSGSNTGSWATDQFYQVDIRNIDWSNYTFTIQILNEGGTIILEESGITFDYLQVFSSATPSELGAVEIGTNNDTGAVNGQTAYTDSLQYFSPPVAPTLSLDAARATEIDLSWSDEPENDSHNVYRAESSGATAADYTLVAEPSGTTYIDTGIESGERYYYRVAGENSSGVSDVSNEVASTTALPPTTPMLDTNSAGEIGVSWGKQDNSSDGEWELYRSEVTGALGTRIADGLAPSTGAYTDSAVEAGEQYYYTLRRITDHDSADGTANAIAALPALADVSVTPGSRDVSISWTVADNSPDGDILIEQKPMGGSWIDLTTLDDDATSYTDTGLLDGERYRYRLTRRTDHAETATTSPAATTNLPAPTSLTVAAVTESSADLSWTASHNYGDTLVQLKPVGGSWQTVATVARDTESYPLSMLRNGERYRARVRARTEHTKTTDQ